MTGRIWATPVRWWYLTCCSGCCVTGTAQNTLNLHETLAAGDVTLPEGVILVGSADDIVVTCAEVAAAAEPEEPAEFGAAEPEVIGRPTEEDKSEEGD